MSNTRQADASSPWRAPLVLLLIVILFVLEGTTRNALFSGSWNSALAILNMGLISAVMALGVNMQWGYAGLFNAGIVGFLALGALGPVLIATAPVPGHGLPVGHASSPRWSSGWARWRWPCWPGAGCRACAGWQSRWCWCWAFRLSRGVRPGGGGDRGQ